MISYRGIIYIARRAARLRRLKAIVASRCGPMALDRARFFASYPIRETRTRVINHPCPISGLSLLRHAVKPDNRACVLHISRLPFRASNAQQRHDDILINCMTRARDASSSSNSLNCRAIAISSAISISSDRRWENRRSDDKTPAHHAAIIIAALETINFPGVDVINLSRSSSIAWRFARNRAIDRGER